MHKNDVRLRGGAESGPWCAAVVRSHDAFLGILICAFILNFNCLLNNITKLMMDLNTASR